MDEAYRLSSQIRDICSCKCESNLDSRIDRLDSGDRTSPTEPPAPPQVPLVAAPVAAEAVVHRVEAGAVAAAAPKRVVAVAAAVDDVARRGPERHRRLVGHVDGLLVHEVACGK